MDQTRAWQARGRWSPFLLLGPSSPPSFSPSPSSPTILLTTSTILTQPSSSPPSSSPSLTHLALPFGAVRPLQKDPDVSREGQFLPDHPHLQLPLPFPPRSRWRLTPPSPRPPPRAGRWPPHWRRLGLSSSSCAHSSPSPGAQGTRQVRARAWAVSLGLPHAEASPQLRGTANWPHGCWGVLPPLPPLLQPNMPVAILPRPSSFHHTPGTPRCSRARRCPNILPEQVSQDGQPAPQRPREPSALLPALAEQMIEGGCSLPVSSDPAELGGTGSSSLHATSLHTAPIVCGHHTKAEDVHERGGQVPAPSGLLVGKASKQHVC